MSKDSVTVQEVCDLLNEMLKMDYSCTHALINNRVQCNQALADHPTVQVRQYEKNHLPKVGLLGILNGLFGPQGQIRMIVDENKILSFEPVNDG
jgi:hypothetical protein